MTENLQAIRDEWRNGGLAACLAGQDVFLPSVPTGRVVKWSFEDEPDLMQTTMNWVDWAVAKSWGISIQTLHANRRGKDVAVPRFMAMYLMSRFCSHRSLQEIGVHFGKADHTTVMHAIKRAKQLLAEDPDFAATHERAVLILEGMKT